jgi:predicted permease
MPSTDRRPSAVLRRLLSHTRQLIADLGRDMVQGTRVLRRRPGLAAVGILTMATGIGASVAVFSFVDSVFLRPLPAQHSGRLVRIYVGTGPDRDGRLSVGAYQLLRDRAPAFDAVVAHYSSAPLYVTTGEESEEVEGAVVSANYFPTLGVRPRLGRFFTAAEDEVPDRDAVAVIGYGLWQRRFGGDSGVLGQVIRVNARDFRIIGVAPDGFNGVGVGDVVDELWIPSMMLRTGYRWCDAFKQQPPCTILEILGRLAPGVSLATGQAEVATMAKELTLLSDPADSLRPVLVKAAIGVDPRQQANFVDLAKLLSAIATFLLVIACAGLGGLLLASISARGTELAIRTSLGAGRMRLGRQLFGESLLVAVLGGAGGVAISLVGANGLSSFYGVDEGGYRHFFDVSINGHVLLFAVGVSLLTAFLLAIGPGIHAARLDPAGRMTRGDATHTRARQLLIAFQVAVSIVMMVAAGLLLKSFERLRGGEGFDPHHVVVFRLRPQLVQYAPPHAQQFLRETVQQLRATPGVVDVAFARGVGLLWESTGELSFSRPGATVPPGMPGEQVEFHEISPRFFATLEVPMLAGREFTDADRPATPRVAIVNASFARRLWPGVSAIGQTIVLDSIRCQIVGVVRDYRLHTAMESPQSMAFIPFWQNDFGPEFDARFAVRVADNPAAALHSLRRVIARVGPGVPMTEAMPLTEQVSAMYVPVHLGGSVLLLAAILAVCLSVVALYGITAFYVAQSTREIGIRLAIGAPRPELVASFVVRGLRAAAIGGLIGFGLAFLGTGLLGRWLVGVRPLDPEAFLSSGLIVGAAVTLACYGPARRAARIDPVAALRGF